MQSARVMTYIEKLHPALFYDSYYDHILQQCPRFSFVAEIHHKGIINAVINFFFDHHLDEDPFVAKTIKFFVDSMYRESCSDDEAIKGLQDFVRMHMCALNLFFYLCTDFDNLYDGIYSQQLRDTACKTALSYRNMYEKYGEEAML